MTHTVSLKLYYDIRGNVTETRELTAFGTLRVTANTYTYSGQPLTSKLTEGSVTLLTENGYHAASGLLHYTSPVFQGGVAETSYLTDESTGDNAENADKDDNQDPAALAAIDSGISDIAGMTKLEYHGPVIYRNGKVETVRFQGGYATIKDGEVTFHYYTQDYLGNNRAVINGSTGAVEQTVAYYPYGAVIADLGTGASVQRFKFGGKELTLHNGLNEYDFGARQYYPAVPHFTSVDPLCEKYYWLSPYLYCGNNPVNFFDSNGMEFTEESYKFVNMLLSNIDNRQADITKKIANTEAELASEDLSNKKFNRLTSRISKLQSSFVALEQVKTEISILENSSQIYNVVRDNSLSISGDIMGNGAETRSGVRYNEKTEFFDVLLGDNSLGLLAHELKHAYQFETGNFSSGKKTIGVPFYDQTDEYEAYERGSMFGQPKMATLPHIYDEIQKQTSGISLLPEIIQNSPSVLRKIAYQNNAVFRWRGVTYNGLH